MAISSPTAPLPYRESYIQTFDEDVTPKEVPLVHIAQQAHKCWALVKPILKKSGEPTEATRDAVLTNTPARIECFWNLEKNEHGMFIFDGRGDLIVSVLNAHMGYGGDHSALCANIMQHLGVSLELFRNIQRRSWGEATYAFVVSRQKTVLDDGSIAAERTHEVRPHWVWWPTT